MPKIDDLPVELVTSVTDYLCRHDDLAAFARTSRKFHGVVDPILYKFAKENAPNNVSWHPLRWAAQNGQTGTLRKALAAGIDVDMALYPTTPAEFYDWDSFRVRVETVCSPALEANQEWVPHKDDTDFDSLSTSTSADDRMPPRRSYSSGRYTYNDAFGLPADDSEDSWNGLDDFDAMDGFDDDAESGLYGVPNFMDDSEAEAAAVAAFYGGHEPLSDSEMDDDDEDDFDDEASLDESEDEDEDEGGHEGAFRSRAQINREISISFRALHLAARGGNDDVVGMLLDHGASIDTSSYQMGRLVHFARRDYPQPNASMTLSPEAGYSPLHIAISHLHESTARLLLSRGASPRLASAQRKDACTALHAAAATGQVDLCRYLLDGGFFEVDAFDHPSTGLTPFYYAYRSGHWNSTVPFLLEKGADINFSIGLQFPNFANEGSDFGGDFMTTLHEACAFGCYTDAIQLINLGADVNKGVFSLDMPQHLSPLHGVCIPPKLPHEPARHPGLSSTSVTVNSTEEERVKLIKLLLRSGADIDAKARPGGYSPLHFLVMHCNMATLRALLAEGANVDSRDSLGQTPLFAACGNQVEWTSHTFHGFSRRESDLDVIKMLMDHGSNVNAKDKNGETALHLACSLSHWLHHSYGGDHKYDTMRIVRSLLQRGAKGGVADRRGTTPFATAFQCGLLDVCDILVRHGQFLSKQEDFGRMLLETIRDRPHHLAALDLLLDLDLNGTLFSKSTYLMKMIDGGHDKLASRYLERGAARPPLSPKDKLTILQVGLARGNEALVKHMLAMKVSVNSPDKNGHSPLYLALQGDRPAKEETVKALLDAGADIHFKPQPSTIMTPLEKAIITHQLSLVEVMLQHQPLRDNPKAPKGVYLHAAARTFPSKRMFSTLIRSGASVTELDSNGDTPLSVFLKSIADQPYWTEHTRGAASLICATVWFLWNNKVDINLRNKSGKAITSYLTALRIHDGNDQTRRRIAEELQLSIEIVPAKGADGEKGLKTLRFRHGLMGLDNFGGRGGPKPPIRL